jgi:predicted membrane GTPase involved in stress response
MSRRRSFGDRNQGSLTPIAATAQPFIGVEKPVDTGWIIALDRRLGHLVVKMTEKKQQQQRAIRRGNAHAVVNRPAARTLLGINAVEAIDDDELLGLTPVALRP